MNKFPTDAATHGLTAVLWQKIYLKNSSRLLYRAYFSLLKDTRMDHLAVM